MLGPVDYLLWFIGLLAEATGLVCLTRAKCLGRYFPLAVYLVATLFFGPARFLVLSRYGLASAQYLYFYYYSDAFLTICLYFALMALFSLVFEEMDAHRYLRVGAVLLLGGTAWFSYQVVAHASDRANAAQPGRPRTSSKMPSSSQAVSSGSTKMVIEN